MQKKYRLRFRFDYSDSKPSWRSQWDKTGPNMVDFAWSQNKTNLSRASIEGKDSENKLVTLAEIDGSDFVNFEWLATVSVPVGAVKGGGITAEGQNVGAVLVTRNERISVLVDGYISVEIRSEEDKGIHLAGFGR